MMSAMPPNTVATARISDPISSCAATSGAMNATKRRCDSSPCIRFTTSRTITGRSATREKFGALPSIAPITTGENPNSQPPASEGHSDPVRWRQSA